MDYELLDIIICLIPLMIVNVYLSSQDDFSHQFIKNQFLLVLFSYIFVIFVPIFVLLEMIHFNISSTIEFYLHEFHPNIVAEVMTIDIDIFSTMIILWCISMIYSSLFISQLALYFLHKELSKYERNDIAIDQNLSKETIAMLEKYKIKLKVISVENFGNIFSLSYFQKLKKQNIIYVCDRNLKVLSNDELNAAIVHEMAHIINKDTIYSPIFNTISKFLFFEPIFQKIRKNYMRKIETRADLYTVKMIPNPKSLAEAIIKTSMSFYKNNVSNRNWELNEALASTKGSEQNFLIFRITNILNYKVA